MHKKDLITLTIGCALGSCMGFIFFPQDPLSMKIGYPLVGWTLGVIALLAVDRIIRKIPN
jgi:hypothetical protein